jgi:D-alanyl-D-alanine carboxypeptidase (penicillin-binding protein 5/6)
MGADSRRILWERDGAARRAPASTTKIMTALVVAGLAQPDQEVTASRRAAATPGSSIWLGEGETLDVGDLLYGLLLTSGNDAAVALAEHVAGSVEGFAVLMNAKAREIGAEETNFRNPHGLDEPGHYTTARDLALITAAALEDPLLAKVVATKKVEIAWPGHNAERVLRNKNRLLWEYDGADGVKTGFTDSAGKCLVASATRNGLQLVAVVMGSPGIWADSRALLDFGFATFSPKVVVRRGEIFRTARVAGGDRERLALAASADLVVPVRRGEEGGVEVVQEGGLQLRAPIKAGSLCGRVRALVDGEEVGSVILLAADDVRAQTVYRSFWGKLWSLFRMMVRNITAAAHRR